MSFTGRLLPCATCGAPFREKTGVAGRRVRFCSRTCSVNQNGTPEERFWNRCKQVGECLEWQGKRQRGYGAVKINGKTYKTHRFAWMLTYGEIPTGLLVCHHCDNPPCCRPDHLFLGTFLDNNRDAIAKKRNAFGDRNGQRKHPDMTPRGEQSKCAKLTEEKVRDIFNEFLANHPTVVFLSRKHGISQSQIRNIVKRRTWRHLFCDICGSLKLKRNGACLVCTDCGATAGCS